jgi:beta-N-acetylhexosaminidase
LDRLESAVGSGELAMPAVEGSVLRLAGVKGPSARCGG